MEQRGIYIDPEYDLNKPFSFEIVKLPEINHQDNFLEPMTTWKYNTTGSKNSYTPRNISWIQSLWRSFGLLAVKIEQGTLKTGGYWLAGRVIGDIIGNRLFNIISGIPGRWKCYFMASNWWSYWLYTYQWFSFGQFLMRVDLGATY